MGSLTLEFATCPTCHGKGLLRGRGGEAEDCPTCEGEMTLPSDVRTDFKPEPAPKRPPKGLRRTAGFRRNPPLAAQFRFAVLHEFGGRCIMLGSALSEGGYRGSGPGDDRQIARVVLQNEAAPAAETNHTPAPSESAAHVCDGPLDPCHIIPKATLRKLGLPETVVFDHRNGVAACRKAHRRNDDGIERFPRELLPPSVEEFAKAHGLTYLLNKLYRETA